MTIPDNRDEPIITKYLTVKDVIELVGKQPLEMIMENKWVRLVFTFTTVKIKVI